MEPAESGQDVPVISSLRTGQRISWRGKRLGARRWFRLLGSATLLALAAVLFAIWIRPLFPTEQTASPLLLDLRSVGLACQAARATGTWSPDGSRIAIIGSDACSTPRPAYADAKIVLFDALSGHPRTTIPLSRAHVVAWIQHAVPGLSTSSKLSTLDYLSPLWSPDGAALAVPFVAGLGTPSVSPQVPLISGIVLVHVHAQAVVVYAHEVPAAEVYGDATMLLAVFEWDTRSGNVIRLNLPSALSYRWLTGGVLLPLGGAAATGGQSNGGRSFQIWQTSQVIFVPCGPGDTQHDIPIVFTMRAAWSPDGRYLIPVLSAAWRDTQTTCSPIPKQLSGLPPIASRDAGMRAAIAHEPAAVDSSLVLFWTRDASRLAIITNVPSHAPTLQIRDAASGHVEAALAAKDVAKAAGGTRAGQAQNIFSDFGDVQWSPDGRRLLLLTQLDGAQGVIYGPRTLGGSGG